MATKNLFAEGFNLDHDGRRLLIERGLKSGLTGEVYRGKLSLPDRAVSVAIKAMRALDFPLAREMFYKEGETLAFLMHLEEETKDVLDETLKIAPVYYGLSEYRLQPGEPGVPYIVMEFVSGTELPVLLKKGPLPEFQSLVIAWHLFRMLDILHSRLQKTFIDLKFENLWWVENEGKWGGQLKMTDFGTLEEIKGGQTRGVARDSLLGGVYLLAMLTGRTLAYSIGELNENAEAVIKHFADKMTWGTRRLIQKILHRNPNARPETAAEILNDIRLLVNLWSQSEGWLSDFVQKNLATAEAEAEKVTEKQPLSKAGVIAAARAYSALDILRIKSPDLFNERDVDRAKAVLSIGDYFERGSALLQGRSFELARQTFEEGILWAEDPALLRRWSYAARIGEEVSPADFEKRFSDLKDLLESINDPDPNPSKWQSAREDFSKLAVAVQDKPSIKSKGLDYLIAECELYENYEKAQGLYLDEKYKEASQSFNLVESIRDDRNRLPPDAAKLIDEEIGNVAASRRNADKLSAMQNSLDEYEKAGSALRESDLDSALKSARAAYLAYQPISNRTFHAKHLSALAFLALELAAQRSESVQDYLRISSQVAELDRLNYGRDGEYDAILTASVKIGSANERIAVFDVTGYCALLEDAHAALGEKGALVESYAVYAAGRAIAGRQGSFLRRLAETLARLVPSSGYPAKWQAKADDLLAEESKQRHAEIDRYLRQAYLALGPIFTDRDRPRGLKDLTHRMAEQSENLKGIDLLLSAQDKIARLEIAQSAIENAQNILGEEDDYRRDEVQNLLVAVKNGLTAVTKAEAAQSQTRREERAAKLAALSKERLALAGQLDWAKRGQEMSLDEGARNLIYLPLRQKLFDFLYRCYRAESGERESLQDAARTQTNGMPVTAAEQISVRALIEWAYKALDMFGSESWRQIAETAAEHQSKIEADSQRARDAFEKGDFNILSAELDRTQNLLGSTSDWQFLKAGLARVVAWKSWCNANLESFKNGQADGNILRDLQDYSELKLPVIYWNQSPAPHYLEEAEKDLRQKIQRSGDTIRSLDFFDALRDLLSVSWTRRMQTGAPRQTWNKKAWLGDAYKFASKKDWSGLASFASLTPVPPNVEDALAGLIHHDWTQAIEEERRQDALQRQREDRLRLLRRFGAIGAVAAVILGICLVGYLINPPFFNQLVSGTFTPGPSPTPTPTSTLTPTLTPTATATFTPVPPTPIPSTYLLDPVVASNLYPPLPVTGDAAWLIDETAPTINYLPALDPPTAWNKGYSYDVSAGSEAYYYATNGEASVTWNMDTPFGVDGYYQVFIVDTEQQSKGPRQFQVSLDGQSAQPWRGTSSVIFLSQRERNTTDAWISLGTYQVNAGQTMSVNVALQLTSDAPFSVDRLLIVRLDEPARQMLDGLPTDKTLVSFLDDPQTQYYVLQDNQLTKTTKERGTPFTDALAWNGSFLSRLLDKPVGVPILVDWILGSRLPPGEYEVFVWIPDKHATIVADYAMLANGVALERPNPAHINQADNRGAWLSLGTWTLPEEAIVGLRMIIAPDALGEIGVDAAAIVRVEK